MSYWNNTLTDPPPNDKDRVLISVDGIYHMATYDAIKRVFSVVENTEQKFRIDEKLIYWTSPNSVLNHSPKDDC